jgi:hypothetical protein
MDFRVFADQHELARISFQLPVQPVKINRFRVLQRVRKIRALEL